MPDLIHQYVTHKACTVEFQTEREDTLYTTLKQVLRNHIVTYDLSYYQTLGACVPVLGYVLYLLHEAQDNPMALVAQTVAEVKERTQQRLQRAEPSLPSFSDYVSATAASAQYQELGSALTMLLTTSGIEYDLSVDATWRVVLSLLADVLAMPVYDEVQTPAEIDAYIHSLYTQLPEVIAMWAEAQDDDLA